MKKFLLSSMTIAALLCVSTAPAWADVVRPAGQTTGAPSASESNSGSVQGQANRSTTGTTNKLTHDGLKEIYD